MQSSNELPYVFSKNAEFVSTSHLFLQNAESAGTPHCACKKCGFQTNSSSAESAWTPILFLQNAEFKRTPHYVLQKCGICFNFPPVFTNCGVHVNSPLCFYNMCKSISTLRCLLKNVELTWAHGQLFYPQPHGSQFWLLYCNGQTQASHWRIWVFMVCLKSFPCILLQNLKIFILC